MSPVATLGAVGILAGAALAWALRSMVDGAAVRTSVNRMQAHLLEFWIFVGEPAAIWKSWRGLAAANARLLRLLARPLLVLTIATLPLFFCLDAWYGTSLLPIDKPALVTLQLDAPVEQISAVPQLHAPPGTSVESPPVRVLGQRQVSWRIRPLRPISGKLQWLANGHTWEKSIAAGSGFSFHSRRRSRSVIGLIRYPGELPLAAGPISWIEVSYPPATLAGFGIEMPWPAWFILFSLVGPLGAIVNQAECVKFWQWAGTGPHRQMRFGPTVP